MDKEKMIEEIKEVIENVKENNDYICYQMKKCSENTQEFIIENFPHENDLCFGVFGCPTNKTTKLRIEYLEGLIKRLEK